MQHADEGAIVAIVTKSMSLEISISVINKIIGSRY